MKIPEYISQHKQISVKTMATQVLIFVPYVLQLTFGRRGERMSKKKKLQSIDAAADFRRLGLSVRRTRMHV